MVSAKCQPFFLSLDVLEFFLSKDKVLFILCLSIMAADNGIINIHTVLTWLCREPSAHFANAFSIIIQIEWELGVTFL